ncbi:MAG: zinc ABC transporter substrate-binding protein [Odoribacteraceae bacterium]|nr:zinc ABC transporter substrate-binding protein [Odoribacteraceae bacterium]
MKTILAIAIAATCIACRPPAGEKKEISVSILPQRYLVQRVAGDLVNINVMIPPGASPHAHDMTPGQLQKLHRAAIYFAIGTLPFELINLYPVLEERQDILLVKHSEEDDTTTRHRRDQLVDPHVWMSPPRFKRMAATIARVLGEKFPDHRDTIRQNLRRLDAEIDSIHRLALRVTADKRGKTFLVYHPALTYFAADYGMKQIAIEHDGKEPSPAHLKEIIDTCRAGNINIVFIQSQFDEQNAKAIAREINGKVISIDPLNPDWKAEMLRLLDIIQQQMQ